MTYVQFSYALSYGNVSNEAATLKNVLADVSTKAGGWYAAAIGLQVAVIIGSRTSTAALTHTIDESPRLAAERVWGSLPFGGSRTELGRRLRVLRQKMLREGYPLLDWEGVERERDDRREGRIL